MVAARKERKWKQDELADRVERHAKVLGCTQPLISQIESGTIVTSRLIRPISEVLQIPEPMHFIDEKMKRWWLAGHLMRSKQMKLFEQQLALVETVMEQLRTSPDDDEAPDDRSKPSRK